MELNKVKGLITLQLKEELAYRFDFFVWSMTIPFFILMHYFLWNAVFNFSGAEVIRGFTFVGIVSYYIVVIMVEIFTNNWVEIYLSEQVKHGGLVWKFTLPISLMKFLAVKTLGERIFAILIFIPVISIVGMLLVGLSVSPINLLFFAVSVFMSAILTFCFSFAFGLVSFWVVEISGFRKMWYAIRSFLGGAIIPITFFPLAVQKAFDYLPFQYLIYVPVQIFLGNFTVNEIISKLIMQFIWITIILVIVLFIWKKAYAKFSGVGT